MHIQPLENRGKEQLGHHAMDYREAALAVRPAAQGFHLSRPANTVLASAAKMLAAAAGKRESWRPMDHVRYLFMLTASFNLWVLRALMDVFTCSSSAHYSNRCASRKYWGADLGLTGGGCASLAFLRIDGADGIWPSYPAAAIGRALSHILTILSVTPAASRKYEFVLAMADRILTDNIQNDHVSLAEVSRAALTSAFSRTCDLLRRSLERSEAAAADAGTWPTRILHHLPMGPQLAACYNVVRHLVPKDCAAPWPAAEHRRRGTAARPSAGGGGEWLEAEKLANELLWITGKMEAWGAAGEAVEQWGMAGELATLALTAHPRVQGLIVKITEMLVREMGRGGEETTEEEIRYRVLAVWVPVLCYASNGVAGLVLTGAERLEMERAMEELIAGLPWEDQEVILANWMEDFAASDSDWPNLQRSFDRWCRHSRKML